MSNGREWMKANNRAEWRRRSPCNINWERVDELLACGCSGVEISASIGITNLTLYKHCEKKFGKSFSDYKSEKSAVGVSLIREQQYKKALGLTDKGDNTLLIWLGKNRLDQRDHAKEDDMKAMESAFEIFVKHMATKGNPLAVEMVSKLPNDA